MLQALDRQSKETLAWKATRDEVYYCPVCQEDLILKQGRLVVHHFAHHPNSLCAYGVGESIRHHEMKFQIGQLFDLPGNYVRYEALLGDHRADLFIRVARLWFVVECQASALGVDEWMGRTRDYNRMRYPILWVWDLPRVVGKQYSEKMIWEIEDTIQRFEVRVPAEIRHCHKQSYGRVYVLDKAGELGACHLGQATERWTDGGPTWDSSSYTPKTLKKPQFEETPRQPRPLRGADGEQLLELGEGIWWK